MKEVIRIKPEISASFSCPECQSTEISVSHVSTPGIYWLADCNCRQCGISFRQSLATGHMIDHPLAINTATHKLYPDDWNMWWQSAPFLNFCTNVRQDEISIRKIGHAQHRKVIILNAIDFLYGHSLLKLYNALHYIDNYKDAGLIVLIPAIFEWLIPQGCAEVWVVDLGLGRLRYSYEALDRFVAKECERFDEVFISKTFNHPDFTRIDMSRFTQVKPFDVRSDAGLIVLIPAIFEWLIPQGCAEVWVVDLGLGRLRYSYEALDRFVAKECERFDEVFISKTFNHPDFTRIDISRFTQVKPFDV